MILIFITRPRDVCEEIIHSLCRIIEQTSDKTLTSLAIFNERLWHLQSRYDNKNAERIPDGEFQSLEDLLEPSTSSGNSPMSKIDLKQRTILCFVLATSFFHAFDIKSSWIRITAANVCFRRTTRNLSIVKPYLSINITNSGGAQLVRKLQEIHSYPSLLTLSIILFEIYRGRQVVIETGKDRCAEVLSIYDDWEESISECSSLIPIGCLQAMRACIGPEQLEKAGLISKNVRDMDVRFYIFERIIYPLGEVISSIYEQSLHQLHDSTPEEPMTARISSMDSGRERAGQRWIRYLKDAQQVLWHRHFENLDDKSATVKVAVLDTGLQLPETFQHNYVQYGYVAASKCKSFCSKEHDATPWNRDKDGHGTQICQILHDVAPNAEIYVAKICKTQNDFGTQRWATEVQQNAATVRTT